MKRLLVSTAAAALALSAAPVSAAPSAYLGQSTGTAAQLTITPPGESPQGLIIGYTSATAHSAGAEGGCEEDGAIACATAAGELSSEQALAHAFFPGQPGPVEATGGALPAEFAPLLEATLGKASAAASGAPAGDADAAAGELQVNATQTILQELPQELTDGIDGILGQLDEGAGGTPFEPLSDALLTIRDNLADAPLLQVFVGPTASDAEGEGDVTATATANGATIVVLPFAGSTAADPQGFAIIDVGEASATATSDGLEATASFSPAIATLSIFNPETGEYETQALEGGSRCIFEGTALADQGLDVCITAGGGTTTEDGATATAEAAAVGIEAFSEPFPTVSLALAAAQATVGGEVAAPAPAPAPAPEPPSMPKTGGGLALPALGLVALGGALHRARRR